MAAVKDNQLRLIVGILLVLAGLPGVGFIRTAMPMMKFGGGMMGYGGMGGSLLSFIFIAAGIWLIIDASKK